MTIDVLLFDELQLSRIALTALLEQREDIRITGTAATIPAALEFAERHRPDIVVVSFDGGDDEKIDIAEKISGLPGCRTLLLATRFTRSTLRRVYGSGIGGIVRRSDSPRRFFEAIELIHQGERAFDAESTVAALVNEDCPLSPRQLSVLEYLSRGETVVEIARRMCLSEGTVRNYVSSVVARLGARNRIDAVRIAQESHWM
jgi:two-component system response regulator DesR